MLHIAKVHVRWDDQDAFGHVNNAKYLTYMQEARVDMFWIDRKKQGKDVIFSDMVVARAEVDYLLPIYDGGFDIDVKLWVSRIGNSSFDMTYELISDKGLHARGKTVQVAVDIESKKARRLNAAEKKLLEEYVG